MPVNIEIKARCSEPEQIRKVLIAANADYKGTDRQTDTYFRVTNGRLKLREGNIENNLIFYFRPDHPGPKQSDVILYKTTAGSKLKEILTAAQDILVRVEKKREIYFIDNVKFHIDEVEDLGSFVEIEAIDFDEDIEPEDLQKQCENFIDLLGIEEKDLISESYSDMMIRRNREIAPF